MTIIFAILASILIGDGLDSWKVGFGVFFLILAISGEILDAIKKCQHHHSING